MRARWMYWGPALLFLLIAMFRLDAFREFVFDEIYYVPAARSMVAGGLHLNSEHPALGKVPTALGIALFGDNPWGWRLLSVLAGTAIVALFAACGRILSGTARGAWIASLIAISSHVILVHARLAITDIFLWLFLVFSFYAYLRFIEEGVAGGRWRWIAYLALGASAAVKWSGFYLLPAMFVYEFWMAYRQLGATRKWKNLAWLAPLARGYGAAVSLTLLAYFAGDAWLFLYLKEAHPWSYLFAHQKVMWEAHMGMAHSRHSYMSGWWTWLLQLRPMWYNYENVNAKQMGTLLVGNPAIFWTIPTVLIMNLLKFRQGFSSSAARKSFFLTMAALSLLLVWAASPRKLTFFYHYIPSALASMLMLADGLTEASQRHPRIVWGFLALCIFLGAWFYPLAAGVPFTYKNIYLWVWVPRWM